MYAGQLEKEIERIITSPVAMETCFRNSPGASTLDAGTALDAIATSPGIPATAEVQQPAQRTVPSDHKHLFAVLAATVWEDRHTFPPSVR